MGSELDLDTINDYSNTHSFLQSTCKKYYNDILVLAEFLGFLIECR